MNYTYTNLSQDFKEVTQLIIDNHELCDLRRESIESGFQEVFDVCLGLGLFGMKFEGRRQFLSNRYFLDAINIQLMPSDNHFQSFISFISNKKKHLQSISDVENFFINSANNLKDEKSKKNNFFNDGFHLPKITLDDYQFLDKNGYLIIPNVIPEDYCDALSEKIIELARYERNTNGGGYIYGLGKSQRIYHLIGKDPIFWKSLRHPLILELMDHFFKRDTLHDLYYLTSYHANILNPGAEPQILHVDAAVPEPLPPWTIRANSNILLQDYTKENGATEIVPGSHLFLRKPKLNEIEGTALHSLEAKKGSLIVWHGHLWHRSGENKSKDSRIALLATFCASHFREMCLEENPYLTYGPNTIENLSPEIKNLLGWYHGKKDYTS